MKNIDYILVGQGIAGSVLACTLIKSACNVLVIDEDRVDTSSKIAYGLCNPIVFKRFVKTFLADEAFAFAKEYYLILEKELGASFLSEIPLYKIFNNDEQRNDWLKKAGSEEYSEYLSKEIKQFDDKGTISNFEFRVPTATGFDLNLESGILNSHGAAEVLNTFLLNTRLFLESVKLFLVESASYRNEVFNYNDLIIEPEGIHYKGIHASKIIFCEGYRGSANPYFSWLPFNLCKGEVLDVKLDGMNDSVAVSNNLVLIPHKTNYKLGSTYSWDKMDEELSDTAKEDLLLKCKKITTKIPEVISQKAAIRPTTTDRRPFLGLHPEYKQLAIFNGMGTKSVMFCPFLAQKFADFLINSSEFPSEVDIKRHLKLYR